MRVHRRLEVGRKAGLTSAAGPRGWAGVSVRDRDCGELLPQAEGVAGLRPSQNRPHLCVSWSDVLQEPVASGSHLTCPPPQQDVLDPEPLGWGGPLGVGPLMASPESGVQDLSGSSRSRAQHKLFLPDIRAKGQVGALR